MNRDFKVTPLSVVTNKAFPERLTPSGRQYLMTRLERRRNQTRYSLGTAAKILEVSKKVLDELTEKRLLPVHNLGAKRWVLRTDLVSLIAAVPVEMPEMAEV